MVDSPTTGMTEDERECIEALARAYLLLTSEEMELPAYEREDLPGRVRYVQDWILARAAKRLAIPNE